ncbi:hypothetical protein HDU91_000340, partial [Kappamyces sp. JEL0680]
MSLYKSKIWMCAVTGKKNLTWKEAADCELKATTIKPKAEPVPKFPAVWIKPTLEIVQHSRLSLNDLIDAVYNYFRGTRFVSEQVFIDVPSSGQERSVERAIIIEKLDNTVPITLEKKREAREAKEFAEAADKIPHDPHHYMVQQVKNKKKTYVVAPNQMRRPRQLLSKATIKLYIKDVASREGKFNAVWLVKDSLVKKYGLATDIPPDPDTLLEKDKKKRFKTQDLMDDPIEDTFLLAPPLLRKLEEGQDSLPERPVPNMDFGCVHTDKAGDLVKVFNFLITHGKPLRLYPFQLDNFLQNLGHSDPTYPAEIVCESFGSVLSIACQTYQTSFDSQSGINPFFLGGWPKPDSNGDFSSNPELNEIISSIVAEYKSWTIHEKVAVDQWFKWRPGQWGHAGKKVTKPAATMEHIKAWPVALFGLIKDTLPNAGEKGLFKWRLLQKILAMPANQAAPEEVDDVKEDSTEEKDDKMDVDDSSRLSEIDESVSLDDEMDELEMSPKKKSRKAKYVSDEEEDELDWEPEDATAATHRNARTISRSSLPSEQVKPIKVNTPTAKATKKAKAAPKKPVMGFDAICTRMEVGFWNTDANERIEILAYIIDEFLQEVRLLSIYRDEGMDKATELGKERRELARQRKNIAMAIAELDKAIANLGGGGMPTTSSLFSDNPLAHELPLDFDSEGGSDQEFDEGRPKRNTRLTRAKKIQRVAAKLADADTGSNDGAAASPLTEEQLEKTKEREALEIEDRQLNRREDIVEFELRSCQASCRLRPLGRDRYCNRYWYFDVAHGCVSMDVVTKIESDPSALKKPVAADPDIPYDYSTGFIFVEEFPRDHLDDEFSALRLGLLDGRWGYFSTVEEFEKLRQWLDRRGKRESTLYHNLEYYKDYIIDGMTKRAAVMQDALEKSEQSQNTRKSSRIARDNLMEDVFGYENWY